MEQEETSELENLLETEAEIESPLFVPINVRIFLFAQIGLILIFSSFIFLPIFLRKKYIYGTIYGTLLPIVLQIIFTVIHTMINMLTWLELRKIFYRGYMEVYYQAEFLVRSLFVIPFLTNTFILLFLVFQDVSWKRQMSQIIRLIIILQAFIILPCILNLISKHRRFHT
jgi:hypothetical protein